MWNNSKSNRQEVGIDKWIANKGIGTFEWTMQFGKTYAGCLIANRTHANNATQPILIATFSQAIKQHWIKNLEEFTSLQLDLDIYVLTSTEIINRANEGLLPNFRLMIVDEIHRFVSDVAYTIFTKVKYRFILGLTGTYPSGNDKKKLDKFCPVIDTITEHEALVNGWIAPFREYNVLLQLPEEDRIRYEHFTEPIREILAIFRNSKDLFKVNNSRSSIFNSDYDVIQACHIGTTVRDPLGKPIRLRADDIRRTLARFKGWHQQLDLSNELGNQIDLYWNPTAIEVNAKKFIDMVRRRNEILIFHPVKLEAVLEIFRKNPVNTICFNESTDFADLIANKINEEVAPNPNVAVVYHSNISSRALINPDTGNYYTKKDGEVKIFGKTSLKNMALDGLHNGTYKFLSTAKALDEGISIPSLRQVITTAGTANPTQYKQRSARGKTVDIYDPNKITNIFNLCFDDFIGVNGNVVKSRDLQKLAIRQQQNAIVPITVYGLEGLNELHL